MQTFPFTGRLDLPLACLLVTERHHALANRTVLVTDVAQDVLDLVDHLDVDAEDLDGLDDFEEAVAEAMDALVEADWLRRRNYRGVLRFTTPPLGEDALAWIRSRLSSDPKRLHDFDELTEQVTELVLERYGEGVEDDVTAEVG